MKAVVMAGGTGSRLRPMLAASVNKHLCPVGGKPLIHWPLETVAAMGITEVLIMGNGYRFLPLMEEVGTGSQFNVRVSYVYEAESAGQSVGGHLLSMRDYLDDEPFVLMLGDSVYLKPIPPPTTQTFQTWAMAIDTHWDDVSKYALVPNNDSLMQTGVWVFPPALFPVLEHLMQTMPTVRIRDAVIALCADGLELAVNEIATGSFIDCGTPDAVHKVNLLCKP